MDRQDERAVAIVTGGSAGIGKAIARALALNGHRVLITGRDRAKLNAAGEALARETEGEITGAAIDASDTDAMARVVDDTIARTGRLDVLVNNAGVGRLVPIADTTRAELERQFAVNVYGPAAAIGAAWPTFIRQKRGCIVNISSWAALDPFPGFLIYSATKAALNSVTRSCWNEGKDHGIRPFTIGPGAVETDLLRSVFDESVMPREACLHPEDIADLTMECIEGRREEALGRCLYIRRDTDTGAVRIALESGGPDRERAGS